MAFEPRIVVRVEAREPGADVATIAAWTAWREAETRRMIDEAARQFHAHLERLLVELDGPIQ